MLEGGSRRNRPHEEVFRNCLEIRVGSVLRPPKRRLCCGSLLFLGEEKYAAYLLSYTDVPVRHEPLERGFGPSLLWSAQTYLFLRHSSSLDRLGSRASLKF